MASIGIVVARGGSVGIPGKNLIDIGGKPLIQWTLEPAIATLDKVYVSTDDNKIKSFCSQFNVEILDREAKLSDDKTTATEVVLDIVCNKIKPKSYDKIFLLQPTSPFRTERNLSKAIKLLDTHFTVVGITELCKINAIREWRGNALFNPLDRVGLDRDKQRQDVKSLFKINGAIFGSVALDLKCNKSFVVEHATPMVMSYKESIEIDTPDDLELARKFA